MSLLHFLVNRVRKTCLKGEDPCVVGSTLLGHRSWATSLVKTARRVLNDEGSCMPVRNPCLETDEVVLMLLFHKIVQGRALVIVDLY